LSSEHSTSPASPKNIRHLSDWLPGQEAYYPVNNDRNQGLYAKYAELAKAEKNVIFGGRLAEYKYYDMDDVIASALNMVLVFL